MLHASMEKNIPTGVGAATVRQESLEQLVEKKE